MGYSDLFEENTSVTLVGRAEQVKRICNFLATTDRGGALLLSGEAGVGKTALLDAAVQRMSSAGTRVLRAAGIEFEADVSYSALNQLLFPLSESFGDLDRSHRDALRVALGLSSGQPPDRLIVSSATLTLLRRLATTDRLLLIIDDLPWVDRASAAVLGFVARRLAGSRIGFLGAMRSGDDPFFSSVGLPEYEVPPLDDQASNELLDARFPKLAGQVRQRLLTVAKGNPLALLELPTALSGPQRMALEHLPAVLPLSQRLQALFVSESPSCPIRRGACCCSQHSTGRRARRPPGIGASPRP